MLFYFQTLTDAMTERPELTNELTKIDAMTERPKLTKPPTTEPKPRLPMTIESPEEDYPPWMLACKFFISVS